MCSCKSTIVYNSTSPNKKEKLILDCFCEKGKYGICFDTGFKSDSVEIYSRQKEIIFKDLLNTDNTIGSAKIIYLSQNYKELVFIFNDKKKLKINLNKDYPIIAIDKSENEILVEYIKFYRKYQ